ncbi:MULTISPECIES: TAXI family TRAP transporter solute-binding subunit [unclassified Pseudonocardia]|uniref:TAXI family TRAP transporter solute-binding subunit n=1 Tax=unclassified Pseudonocardia TaxID=2619320 RepID=UPI0009ECA169|nr:MULTISPECIES: TAXI family TRAP transporter solute-binding subunit [unclassified Pseudonocardia]
MTMASGRPLTRRSVLFLLASGLVSSCHAAETTGRIRFATIAGEAPQYRLGDALAREWRIGSGVEVDVVRGPGSASTMNHLRSGTADVAIATVDSAMAELERSPGFALRALARLHDDVVHAVVPAESALREIADLGGRRISVEDTSSGIRALAPRILEFAGIDPAEEPAREEGLQRSIVSLERREIDAFLWAGAVPTFPIVEASRRYPVRLLDLERLVPIFRQHFPLYSATVVPRGIYAGTTGPIDTVAVRNLLLVREDFPEELAYALTLTTMNRRADLVRAAPVARAIDPMIAIMTLPVPLHRGAERAYRALKNMS